MASSSSSRETGKDFSAKLSHTKKRLIAKLYLCIVPSCSPAYLTCPCFVEILRTDLTIPSGIDAAPRVTEVPRANGPQRQDIGVSSQTKGTISTEGSVQNFGTRPTFGNHTTTYSAIKNVKSTLGMKLDTGTTCAEVS